MVALNYYVSVVVRLQRMTCVSHLEVAQEAEAWWDLFQTIVVQVDLTDIWDAG